MARSTVHRRNQYAGQVSAETQVKYGPEETALKILLSQALADREQGLAVNRSTARGLVNLARASTPAVGQFYDQAAGGLREAQAGLPIATPGVSGPAAAIAAGSQRDFAGAQARLAAAMAATKNELVQRQLDAQAGAIAGSNAVRSQYAKDVGQVRQRLLDLSGEEGAFAQGRLGDLAQADRKLRHDTNVTRLRTGQEERNSLRSAGINPDTGQPIPGGKLDPKAKTKTKRPQTGLGSLGSTAENKLVEQIKGATSAITQLAQHPNADSTEIRTLLAAGKVDGVKYPHDVINAAYDLVPPELGGRGGLSSANVKALHRIGVHVKGRFPLVAPSKKRAAQPFQGR